MIVIEAVIVGFLSAIGWYGANYYVIGPYLPEPEYSYAAKHKEEKKTEESKEITQ